MKYLCRGNEITSQPFRAINPHAVDDMLIEQADIIVNMRESLM